jgi:hypothetical protein
MSESSKKIDGISIVQGAFSLFTAAANSTADKGPAVVAVEKSPMDIPKEELMALCMKMNKRMQSLEAKNTESTNRINRLVDERRILLDLITSTINLNISAQNHEDINTPLINDTWNQYKEQQQSRIFTLEQDLADVQDTLHKTLLHMEAGKTINNDENKSLIINEDNQQMEIEIKELKAEIQVFFIYYINLNRII